MHAAAMTCLVFWYTVGVQVSYKPGLQISASNVHVDLDLASPMPPGIVSLKPHTLGSTAPDVLHHRHAPLILLLTMEWLGPHSLASQ